ncbi:MAG: UDP-N-acetylglucosamine 2-epimerase (non-hydrolyzing) [Magnetococcales bacterium]|nr:UDP-N-acetylglucosamine 2-epimerase (non-hydrolyzing) [Magnetococcales bacterium]
MKILTILGARPQFIKSAAVSRAIRRHNEAHMGREIREVIVHTGQHFDANMSDVFFEQLDICPPNHNLGIANLGHGAMTGRMLEGIEVLIQQEKPDCVLVYGDTNSTLAGALAASKLQVPVAHVEAGLRSHNLAMPEEINRTLTDRISLILFCPTQAAVDNLRLEGYPFPQPGNRTQHIQNVGDVMYDVTLFYRDRVARSLSLDSWGVRDKEYALCTLHRAENTDDIRRLDTILSALRDISLETQVVFPIHPRTRNLLARQNYYHWLDGLMVVDPVPYLEMQRLEMGACAILTDSGGIQKEAYFHQVPCITLRDETEWEETVLLGWNQVVGANHDLILSAYHKLQTPSRGTEMPYGEGDAAIQIIKFIREIR